MKEVDKLQESHAAIQEPMQNLLMNADQATLSYQRELKRNQDISRKLVSDIGKANQVW